MINTVKPSYKQIIWDTHSCFNIKIDQGENLSNTCHYHPEIEFILLKRSEGTRIVGTSVESFKHNDLILIGKNLPHAFLHEEKYLNAKDPCAEALVIQFYENFLGNEFLNLPEFRDIYHLLIKARQGLCITDQGKEQIIPLMERCFHASSLDRIILLLEILKRLTHKDAYRVLVKEEQDCQIKTNDKRFNNILDYTYANFDEHITIEEVAKMANLTKESFCRYFKSMTHKTYMEFLTGFRISKACQMLKNADKSVKEISYSCGFDSLSNFYYQFKKITGLSPLEFKCSKNIHKQEQLF